MTTVPSRVRLTAARVEAFACPPGKSQAFLWDTDAPALAVRATPTGRKTYTFESRLHGKTLRERARMLIQLAAPQFREELTATARARRIL